jgi:glycosyltransferase involved in cell wall biosynthesis
VKPVVLWQGSITHNRDVQLIAPAIEQLQADGKCFPKMWSFDVPGVYRAPNVPFEAFYQMFSQMDGYIGLAPLTTLPFNRSKSNLKFLEYTALGMATVATNFGPYAETIVHNETGLLIDDNRDWFDAINSLLTDKTLYNKIVENATKFVRENFDIEITYKKWVEAFDEISQRS